MSTPSKTESYHPITIEGESSSNRDNSFNLLIPRFPINVSNIEQLDLIGKSILETGIWGISAPIAPLINTEESKTWDSTMSTSISYKNKVTKLKTQYIHRPKYGNNKENK
jgi:hypothetical protein